MNGQKKYSNLCYKKYEFMLYVRGIPKIFQWKNLALPWICHYSTCNQNVPLKYDPIKLQNMNEFEKQTLKYALENMRLYCTYLKLKFGHE